MWQKNINMIFIILVFWLVTVNGSCLEYGHSCWGAHGKRSAGKVLRPGADITNADFVLLPDSSNENHIAGSDATAHGKNFYETLQYAEDNNAMQPLSGSRNNNDDEIITPSNNQQIHTSKLRNLLRKRHSELLTRRSSMFDVDSAELPELSNRPNNQERWRRVSSVLKLKNFNDDVNERTRQQDARKKPQARTTEEGSSYFDYN